MSRAALAAAVAVAAAVGVAAILLLTGSSKDSEKGFGHVAWDEPPAVFHVKTLPRDRILSGRLRNEGLKEIVLKARTDVKLVDAKGRPVDHSVIFSDGYGRDIYPPRDRHVVADPDQVRLGYKAKIKPGSSSPITLAWRIKSKDRIPVRVELPGGVLRLPSGD